MKSRTSSCKRAAFRKDMGRFWPVWVGYILCLILFQVTICNDDLEYWYAANMGTFMSIMGIVNGAYGLVVAQMLFGDLFGSRMCNGLHALPLRREQWFGAHIRAGFLFSLIPTALMAGLSEAIIYLYSEMVNGWQIPLYWFAAANIQYIFFFGLAVFCVMCSGNRFGATVLYGIANFGSLLLYLLVDQLYTPLLKGVITLSAPFYRLSPMAEITALRYVNSERQETGRTYLDTSGIEQREYIGRFEVISEGWIYTAILAAVGIALLLLARQMYKRRHLECAGDFLAVRWLEPVFQVVFTVLCGSGFHAVFLLFFGLGTEFIYLVFGICMIVGWFVGRMFLERSTRVFQVKNILGFLAVAAAMALSLFVTSLDPLGVETWLPDSADVKGANLSLSYQSVVDMNDPEEIADLIRLHEIALEQDVTVHEDYDSYFYNPYTDDPDAARVELTYIMDNGFHVRRKYHVLAEGEGGDIIRKYCSRLDAVITDPNIDNLDDLRHEIKDADNVTVEGNSIPKEYVTEEFLLALADAIAADCEAGNMVQIGTFHPGIIMESGNPDYPIRMLNLHINDSAAGQFYIYLNIYADSVNTLAVLEPTGILDHILQEYNNIYG